jgi:nicotinamidase-related amidase
LFLRNFQTIAKLATKKRVLASNPARRTEDQALTALKGSGQFIDDQVHEAVTPHPGEIVVFIRRVFAFAGSDLEIILRSHDINHLILTGIAASGVVLSAPRQAADANHRLTVLSDCGLDNDAGVHSVLFGKIFPRQATVMGAESPIASLASANSGRRWRSSEPAFFSSEQVATIIDSRERSLRIQRPDHANTRDAK